MKGIKVNISNKQNKVKIPTGIKLLVRRCCSACLASENVPTHAEVDISFVDNKTIRSLNKQFRDKDAVTDVLSFPLGHDGEYDKNPQTGAIMLGDVAISIETAMAQAEAYGHTLHREIGFLTIHSILHLLGYDHETSPRDAAIMREKEEIILETLSLTRNTGVSVFHITEEESDE